MKFTERFNELIKISEKTQTEIAKEINVSKQCVTDYKSGKSFPSLETLCLICKALDTTSDYLLGITTNFKEQAFTCLLFSFFG